MRQRYQSRGLVIFGMNASIKQDRLATLQAFASQTGIRFPILRYADHLFRVYGRQQKMPLEVLIDTRGRIAHLAHRFDIKVLTQRIEALLPR